jgi:phenylpropionate dioxygenase-like ring-hydroxylating dioxygenase large terminal subunit
MVRMLVITSLDYTDELEVGGVKEIKALGRVFVLWRTADGKPVCQDAYCIHLGANLAAGGSIVDNCIECPFHKWLAYHNNTPS